MNVGYTLEFLRDNPTPETKAFVTKMCEHYRRMPASVTIRDPDRMREIAETARIMWKDEPLPPDVAEFVRRYGDGPDEVPR